MGEGSKILFIGGSGYIGKFIVETSVKAGHPTFALVRESTVSDPVKGKLIESFRNSGVTLLYGDLYDHESLVKAIKQVDVVISTVGQAQLAGSGAQDQVKIIAAIKEAGNIKRFFPSSLEMMWIVSMLLSQQRVPLQQRLISVELLRLMEFPTLMSPQTALQLTFSQPGATAPPIDKIIIQGDGNVKVVYNQEVDIGTYTIKDVDDPRTLNKIIYIKPPSNTYSFNEPVSLWERDWENTRKDLCPQRTFEKHPRSPFSIEYHFVNWALNICEGD